MLPLIESELKILRSKTLDLEQKVFGQCVLQDGQCEEMLLKVSLNTMMLSANCRVSALRHGLGMM